MDQNIETRREMYKSIERRFHIVLTAALFFPAVWEKVLAIAGVDALKISDEILSFGAVVAIILVGYLVFEASRNHHSMFFLKWVRFSLLATLAAFIVVFLFLAVLKNGQLVGWQQIVYGASFISIFMIPIATLLFFTGTPIVEFFKDVGRLFKSIHRKLISE